MKYLLFLTIIFISFFYAADAQAGAKIRPSLNNGLVGYWNFDVGKGHSTAYDMSGNRNHGTLTNMDPAADWVDSATTNGRLLGQALNFDGSNDYVDIDAVANDFSTNSDLTASLWIKANNNHTFGNNKKGCFLGFHSSTGANKGFLLCIGDQTASANDNELMVYDGTSEAWEITTNTVIGDNTWHHIVYIRSGTTGDVYIDTINKGSHTPNWTHASNDKWSVGQEWDGGAASDFTDGSIDEVRIYNRALSAAEISRLYNLSKPKFKVPTNNGLIGYWSFNEGTGTVAGDASGNKNNGAFPGGTANPTWTTGKLGQALNFDGSNDYVSLGDIGSGLSAITITAWINTDDITPFELKSIISKSDVSPYTDLEYNFNLELDSRIRFWTSSNGSDNTGRVAYSTGFITQGWNYVAATYDGSKTYVYLNSVRGTGVSASGNIYNGVAAALIGDWPGAGSEFSGSIDEVRIYNRALNVTEIKNLYNSGLAKINASTVGKLNNDLVGHWSFDGPDMAGVTAFDRSGQGNNGTLTNGPTRAIGRLGQALDFDGSNDYVDMGQPSSINFERTNSYTMVAWVRKSSRTDPGAIVSRMNNTASFRGYDMLYCGTSAVDCTPGMIKAHVINTWSTNAIAVYVASGGKIIDDGQWHQVIVTYDGSSQASGLKIFIDAAAQTTTIDKDVLSATVIPTVSWKIGRRHTSDIFRGLIDEVRIYNRALSADEIKRLYNMGR